MGDFLMGDSKPWQDEDTLRRLYHDQELSQSEIAEELGTEQGTVSWWMDKLGIETRDTWDHHHDDRLWRDEERMRALYIDERMTAHEIADEFGCSSKTVLNWLNRHGIETRVGGRTIDHMNTRVTTSGHIEWKSDNEYCGVHRLLVIANGADPHIVFDGKHHVHHINGIPWDNRSQNLEVLTQQEHYAKHRMYDRPSCKELARLYQEERLAQSEIAKEFGCSSATVSCWMEQYGIEARDGSGYHGDEYPWRHEETLRKMYVKREKSTTEIADELGCGNKTVSQWLQKHDIETRDRGGQYRNDYLWRDEETLREMYIEKEMSTRGIADELGCGSRTVSDWLNKHNIETRGRGSQPSVGND
jgi:transposase-like protein